MQIVVKGKNLDVPAAIKAEAVDKLSKVRRLFDRFIDMEVTFSEDKNPRITDKIHCEVVLHAKGKYLRATAAGPDPLTAIDRAQAKLERQVRKLKTKLVDKARQTAPTHEEANEAAMAAAAAQYDEAG